ncbi:MAG TPA: hypothetical protein PK239_14170 [Chitinophagales bacterium]|nr:hypothetical protein [Chitinophagales bacterium]
MLSIPAELLESVQRHIRIHQDYLVKVARAVLEQGISQYPIFVLHREAAINIGKPIIIAAETDAEWSVNASLIEEFIRKGIITPGHIDEFKEVYRNPYEYLCVFIISGQSDAGFAFCPYSDQNG